ncbi:hypothetical protein HBI65_017520 [Parastagonospora nodorum]|nr:hypothetical protein HBI33_021300 [Parastagonospora nodorum]KAH6107818.1 hypothetical protein HBI65_017520 [Parastagonospora nodorum]
MQSTSYNDLESSDIPPAESVTSSPWSKEALFGLLAVLLAIVVPCLALLARCLFRWRKLRRIQTFHSDVEQSVDANAASSSSRPKRRRRQKRRGSDRTVLISVRV